MLRIFVDFNEWEGRDSVNLRFDIYLNEGVATDQLTVGDRVLLYDQTVSCQAILRNGGHTKFVGELLRNTIKDISEDEFNRLQKR